MCVCVCQDTFLFVVFFCFCEYRTFREYTFGNFAGKMNENGRRKSINKTVRYLCDIEYIKHYNYYEDSDREDESSSSKSEDTNRDGVSDVAAPSVGTIVADHDGNEKKETSNKENIADADTNYRLSFSFVRVSNIVL